MFFYPLPCESISYLFTIGSPSSYKHVIYHHLFLPLHRAHPSKQLLILLSLSLSPCNTTPSLLNSLYFFSFPFSSKHITRHRLFLPFHSGYPSDQLRKILLNFSPLCNTKLFPLQSLPSLAPPLLPHAISIITYSFPSTLQTTLHNVLLPSIFLCNTKLPHHPRLSLLEQSGFSNPHITHVFIYTCLLSSLKST